MNLKLFLFLILMTVKNVVLEERGENRGNVNENVNQIIPKTLEKKFSRNCRDVQRSSERNELDIYRIKPESSSESFLVRCEMKVKGGGWTYVLNRYNGSQNFDLNWTDYKNGFGNLKGEFWLGLEHLYQLTGNKTNEVLFELVNLNLQKFYIHHTNFSIAGETEGYKIKVLERGDYVDYFKKHLGAKFSTKDKHQGPFRNCAANWKGGWWYTDLCTGLQFTTKYKNNYLGLLWFNSQESFPIKEVRMLIKPKEL